jgi:cytidine deaminase
MTTIPADILELIDQAQRAARQAYNPYSRFSVGCAIRSTKGLVYLGCNIENASYSVTICAERVAASQAVLAGDLRWDTIVVVSPQAVSMCGVCRQFVHEFAPQIQVWTGYLDHNRDIAGPFLLSDLLPSGMTLKRTDASDHG